MSDEVESMAYTNEVPWHRLGTYVADAPSVEEMIALAGLDWRVEKRPLVTASKYLLDEEAWTDFDLDVDGFYALVRNTDQRVLDVVGSRYIPTQPHEAFEFLNEFVEAGDATMETAGSLRGGRYLWGLANLNQGFNIRGRDEVKGYVLVACPYEQGKALLVKLTHIRVVCMNTLSLALKDAGAEFRMSHRQIFDANMIEKAKDVLGLAREEIGQFEKNARKLKKLKVSTGDAIRVITPIMSPKVTDEGIENSVEDFEEHATPRIAQIMDVYENAPGADPGTGWGVLNAVTYWSDHVASRTADKRLTNAWFGRTARQKEKVLDALLEMAA
jgi:phage/plasmid-like protein (TIGR03299 family)